MVALTCCRRCPTHRIIVKAFARDIICFYAVTWLIPHRTMEENDKRIIIFTTSTMVRAEQLNLSRVSWPREQKESQVYEIYCLWDFSREEVSRKITAVMLLLFFLLRFSRKTQAGSSARPLRIFYLLQLDSALHCPS